MMTEQEKIKSEKLYLPQDPEILAEQNQCLERLYEYNATHALEQPKRDVLLKLMFAEVGENCHIEAPFYANWAGRNVHLGDQVYANFNLTMVDDTDIYIGSRTMIGPNVTIATAGHPVLPELRAKGYQYNLPVKIGENCWIGAGAVILPGVTVGDNSVIGAGSIVTRDIPSDVVAVGNPCRVMRKISDYDHKFFRRGMPIDWSIL